MRHWLPTVAVVLVGVAAAATVALASGASVADAGLVVGLATIGSAFAAAVSALCVRRLRRLRLRTYVLAISIAASITVVTGVLIAAAAMFIAPHDVGVLVVVVLASTAVSAGAAMALGSAFERSALQVEDLARGLTDGSSSPVAPSMLVTGELQALARQLAAVSSELEDSRRRERALDAARRDLVASVSHDLRSPIASIRAMAEALDDHVVDDSSSIERYHHAIRMESEHLGALVDDLFELSRIAAGAIDVSQPLAPFGELVSETVDRIEPSARARGVRIVNLLDDAPEALVPASDVRRVVHNLLDNAIRHTRTGGTIVLDGEIAPRFAKLEVTDECGGIPADDLDRIFDVAFRGDVARTRDESGGGLGLAIAKGLVEAHQGSVDAHNFGNGCRFTVRFPTASL